VASYSHLRKLSPIECENALAILDELLPPGVLDARDSLHKAQRNVVGSKVL
jgi:hypothetical protein